PPRERAAPRILRASCPLDPGFVPSPPDPSILIHGAGPAGLTLAWWLHRAGARPTVLEKRPDLSDRGYMIDFYGSGFDVAEKMGLRDALAARHYPVEAVAFVDRDGDVRARL